MIIPAVLEQTPQEALDKILKFAQVAPKIQLDIADGELVRGKTFLDISFLENVKHATAANHSINIEHKENSSQPKTTTQVKTPLHLTGAKNNLGTQTPIIQLHLMVQNPEVFILLIPPSVKEVCVQIEAFMYRQLSLEAFDDVLRAKKIKIGLSFNHNTPFEDFEHFINQCDFIQFMTVDPGAQGRAFIMESLDKISRFKEKYPNKILQVDGGISQDTLPMVLESGADHLVIGSAIFKSEDPIKSYKNFVLQYEYAKQNSVNSPNSSNPR